MSHEELLKRFYETTDKIINVDCAALGLPCVSGELKSLAIGSRDWLINRIWQADDFVRRCIEEEKKNLAEDFIRNWDENESKERLP